ncbi:hypothetical protein J1605_020564 [Eschrichtius robustus]|uniref:Fibrinogen C-terminal domain-containing protein n=1 Tax=Eschrichtius robustus TaxID=9764 RepID=A0AB34HL45_ESCRO|nr:hypothetical protein J1605_020564 [Eschrichtius robustus]
MSWRGRGEARWAAAGQPLPHCAFSPRRRGRLAGVPGQHAGEGQLGPCSPSGGSLAPPEGAVAPGSMAAALRWVSGLFCVPLPWASSEVQAVLLEPQGRDCSQIWVENQRAPVVCTPASQRSQCPVQEGSLQFVFCDKHTDSGWMVIQSQDWGGERLLDFERCRQEYKEGFGDWGEPGLRTELTVDLQDVGDHSLWARSDSFRVNQGDQFYWLYLPACTQGHRGWGEGWDPRVPNFSAYFCQPQLSGEGCSSWTTCRGAQMARIHDGGAAEGLHRGHRTGDTFQGSGGAHNQEGCGFSTLHHTPDG